MKSNQRKSLNNGKKTKEEQIEETCIEQTRGRTERIAEREYWYSVMGLLDFQRIERIPVFGRRDAREIKTMYE